MSAKVRTFIEYERAEEFSAYNFSIFGDGVASGIFVLERKTVEADPIVVMLHSNKGRYIECPSIVDPPDVLRNKQDYFTLTGGSRDCDYLTDKKPRANGSISWYLWWMADGGMRDRDKAMRKFFQSFRLFSVNLLLQRVVTNVSVEENSPRTIRLRNRDYHGAQQKKHTRP